LQQYGSTIYIFENGGKWEPEKTIFVAKNTTKQNQEEIRQVEKGDLYLLQVKCA